MKHVGRISCELDEDVFAAFLIRNLRQTSRYLRPNAEGHRRARRGISSATEMRIIVFLCSAREMTESHTSSKRGSIKSPVWSSISPTTNSAPWSASTELVFWKPSCISL